MRKTKWLALGLLCCASALALLTAPMPQGTGLTPALPAALAQAEDVPFYRNGPDIVYVTRTGYCYHAIPNCVNSTYTYELTGAEAIRLGYRQCSNCEPVVFDPISTAELFSQDETLVYMMVQDEHYHASDICKAFDKPEDGRVFPPVQITLDEARYLEKDRCPVCKPPKY